MADAVRDLLIVDQRLQAEKPSNGASSSQIEYIRQPQGNHREAPRRFSLPQPLIAASAGTKLASTSASSDSDRLTATVPRSRLAPAPIPPHHSAQIPAQLEAGRLI